MIKGGYPYYGEAIGILMFDNRRYPMIPGNVGNASTYDFPVRLKVVKGLNWYPPPVDEWGESPPRYRKNGVTRCRLHRHDQFRFQ